MIGYIRQSNKREGDTSLFFCAWVRSKLAAKAAGRNLLKRQYMDQVTSREKNPFHLIV